jgi:hypothetical protein
VGVLFPARAVAGIFVTGFLCELPICFDQIKNKLSAQKQDVNRIKKMGNGITINAESVYNFEMSVPDYSLLSSRAILRWHPSHSGTC